MLSEMKWDLQKMASIKDKFKPYKPRIYFWTLAISIQPDKIPQKATSDLLYTTCLLNVIFKFK